MTPVAARTVLLVAANAAGAAAFLWPLLLPAAAGGAVHAVDGPIVLAVLVGVLGALLFVELGRGGLGPKAVALVAVLGAAMAALRLPGFVAGFSAMFVVVLVAGNAFGPAFGFVLGAVGTFASALFVGGIGPWLPFQMVAVGWVGLGAGVVPRARSWPLRVGALALYGALSGFLFGAVMNLWFWPFAVSSGPLGWAPELGLAANLRRYGGFYVATSLGWDAARAAGNAALVAVAGRPLLGALDRAAHRMQLTLEPFPRAASRGMIGGGREAGRAAAARRSPGRGKSGLRRAGRWGNPRRGDPRTVPQKADRPASRPGKGETVG